ncbi:oligogalacturonate-specific porin KdgM family protein [Bacillus sp. B-TM1]
MNSYLKISLAGITMLSCLSPTLVCAEQPHGFIDYRHEYLDDTRTHADRVEFGTFFSNGIGLMGELRYNTDEGDKDKWDPSQFGNNGTGLTDIGSWFFVVDSRSTHRNGGYYDHRCHNLWIYR